MLVIDWHQPNESSNGRKAAEWYLEYNHGKVVSVTDYDGNTVSVFADGEMRYNIYELQDGEIVEAGVVRYPDQFHRWGIETDSDLFDLPEAEIEWGGYNTLKGPTPRGYYVEEINNPWFDLYLYSPYGDNADHLDFVCHEIEEALEAATEYLAGGRMYPPVHR